MFNPAKASKTIRNSFIDYISTAYSFADKNLQKQFKKELNSNISKGPLLEIHDVFESGKSINDLIDEGVLSPLFRDLESGKPSGKLYKRKLPLDRPLYKHQEEAIRCITSGNNAVISTGTGSGKTNCFLIPVLNELLREIENNTLNDEVRALFIYPMNALANDQLKNIRQILMCYPDITFGVYNGSTENKEDDAINVYEAMFMGESIPELRHKLPNEILSRDEMKKTPPNILFTNYAMLEHLLLRPKDAVLFKGSNFKFVVLDEAHIYTGATGIETSLLLSRLRARLDAKNTQFILTSATLGTGKESDEDITKFAHNLCGVKFNKNNIIRGTREEFNPCPTPIKYQESLFVDLANEENVITNVLDKYNVKYNKGTSDEELLYDLLINSSLYNHMRLLKADKNVYDVSNLANDLNISEDTSIAFISLCTKAQKNCKSLLDARYHFFIRSLEGCFTTIDENDSKLFLSRKKEYVNNNTNSTKNVFEVALCTDCGRLAYVGKIADSKLVQSNKMDDNVEYFYRCDENIDDNIVEDDYSDNTKNKDEYYYYLCPKCGAIFPTSQKNNIPCECDKSQYIVVKKANNLERGARCGICHTGYFRRFYLGNDAATSVLATSLYETLPESEFVEDDNTQKSDNPFISKKLEIKKREIKKGRQFLAFSDSRQEAAKFACYLSKSYQEFLRRRGIYQVVETEKNDFGTTSISIKDMVLKLTNKFNNNNSFTSSNTDLNGSSTALSNENAWVAVLNELYRFNAPTSLTSLGVLQFRYLGNDNLVDVIVSNYNVSKEVAKGVLDLLAFEIVKSGAIIPDNPDVINADDRNYIFYSQHQRYINSTTSDEDYYTKSWCSKSKNGDPNNYYLTTKMYHLVKALGISNKDAYDLLSNYFEYLKDANSNEYHMIADKEGKGFAMPTRCFEILFNSNKDAHWYKCSNCGKVTTINIGDNCPNIRCNGHLIEIDPNTLFNDNHFANLYSEERMSPLLIKEHTAQLDRKEGAEYQEQFIKKEINALSCSTTFEMGVDVGDLETVFLRDVPPLPSNYAQRAGRAGRSINAAAFALTFAKLSSHDLSFFKNPKEMISGSIEPPLFKIDNEKIVRRHVYAVALSSYFALHEDMYNHNNANNFINNKGYLDFIDWLHTKPEALKDLLKRSIPTENNLHERIGIDDFSWVDSFSGKDGVFTELINNYEQNIKDFEDTIKKYTSANDLRTAGTVEGKLRHYKYNKLIDFLARGNILPRYGFPVDTVELKLHPYISDVTSLSLNRDLQIAVSEYAPSAEVIANGRLYTSRYIQKTAVEGGNKEWDTSYLAICNNPDCQALNYSKTPVTESFECISCHNPIPKEAFVESIEPRSGFVTEKVSKDVPMTRQEKVYRSQDYYIGNEFAKTIERKEFRFNNINVSIESTTNDSLLVKSSNEFYVCPNCGYAITIDEARNDYKLKIGNAAPSITLPKEHTGINTSGSCKTKKLNRYWIHHKFNTDVAKISFGCDTSDLKTMLSTMYAILNALSKYLNIERRDIKACLSTRIIKDINSCEHSIIIYDAVPGGAGHSRRLVTDDGKILYDIFMLALKNMEECNCDPSCYNCLRSYENQRIHDKLDRHLAKDFLEQFKGNINVINTKQN